MDYQESVEIVVYEGERPLTKDNRELGRFMLKGIERKPRGGVQIEVSFTVNKDGILKVAATEQSSDGKGKAESIEINQQTGRLSDEEIEEMVRDAERYAEEDAELKARIDAKSALESYVQSVQAILDGKHDETKHVAEEVEQVKDAITDAQDFVRQNMEADPDEYNEAKSEAEKIVGPILAKYMGGGAGGAPGADDDDIDEDDDGPEDEL